MKDGREQTYLSGETIGICAGGKACRVSVGRLVGGLGLSALLPAFVSVIVWSGLGVAISANRSEEECVYAKLNENPQLLFLCYL